MKIDPESSADFSAQIAQSIRGAIVSGDLLVDQRLPSEAELEISLLYHVQLLGKLLRDWRHNR